MIEAISALPSKTSRPEDSSVQRLEIISVGLEPVHARRPGLELTAEHCRASSTAAMEPTVRVVRCSAAIHHQVSRLAHGSTTHRLLTTKCAIRSLPLCVS